MKVVAVSRDGMYYKIGESYDVSTWYKKGNKDLQRGDEVDIEWKVVEQNGRKVRELTKVIVNNPTPSAPTGSSPSPSASPNKFTDRSSAIERQTILKCASEAVKAMAGQFSSVDNLANSVITIFRALNDEFYNSKDKC